jgi:hypothetical protein
MSAEHTGWLTLAEWAEDHKIDLSPEQVSRKEEVLFV